MAPKTTDRVLVRFGPQHWSGQPNRGATNLFFRSGFVTFIVCLFLMVFIEPLRNTGAILLVCTSVAVFVTSFDVGTKARRENEFLTGLTARTNDLIIEMTGDPTLCISSARLRQLIEKSGNVVLKVNGVPGLDLRVDGTVDERRVVATVTAPDYGLDSFDLLLADEEHRLS